jgi:hypothetical protein
MINQTYSNTLNSKPDCHQFAMALGGPSTRKCAGSEKRLLRKLFSVAIL